MCVNRGTIPFLSWASVSSTKAWQLRCVCLSSITNKFGGKRVCSVILSYCTWKRHLFSASLGSIFSRWNQAWDKSIQSFSHTPTHKSHFLPDLKCNSSECCLLSESTRCPHPDVWSPLYIIYESNPETRQRENEQGLEVSVVMKLLFSFMSLWVYAHFHFSISSPICYPSDWRSNYNFLPSLAPMLSNKCHGLSLCCALIFQLLWVNRDELTTELKLFNHLIWSWAKFQRLSHKHQGHCLQKLQVLEETAWIDPLLQRAVSAGTSLPQVTSHSKKTCFQACQRDTLTFSVLSWCPSTSFNLH